VATLASEGDAIRADPWRERLERSITLARTGSDPEAVHQVRVAEARLRVWLDLGGRRGLERELRRLRRLTSHVRDLDVALGQGPPPLAAARLGTEWARARASLSEALEGPRLAHLLERLAALPAVPHERAERAVSRLARRVLRRGARAWKHRVDTDALHRLRRAARRLRYALEWIGRDAGPIQSLQEALGEACDRVVALQHLGRGPGTGGYRRQLAESLQDRVRHARKVWRRTRPALRRFAPP
jgi:CHAD domain-containing protein